MWIVPAIDKQQLETRYQSHLQDQESFMPIRKEGLHEGRAVGMSHDGMRDSSSGSATGGSSPMGSSASQYISQTVDAAAQAKDYLSDRAARVGDKFRDTPAIDYSQAIERVKEHTRRKPGQSLLISASAGFVIGLLLRGRRRK